MVAGHGTEIGSEMVLQFLRQNGYDGAGRKESTRDMRSVIRVLCYACSDMRAVICVLRYACCDMRAVICVL